MSKISKRNRRVCFIILVVAIIAGGIAAGCGSDGRKKDKRAEYRWPTSELAGLIPRPQSAYGKINSEREDYFSVDIYDVTGDQFEDYIDTCKERGFTVDYTRLDGYYSAEDTGGFSLRVSYDEEEKEMSIMLSAPDEDDPELPKTEESAEAIAGGETYAEKSSAEESAEENREEEDAGEADNLVNGMRPEFKEAMDSYEAFYDEYCDFMKKYMANPTDLTLLAQYADMTQKLIDMGAKFDQWEDMDLNSAEMKYYMEVSGRIAQKLLEAAQ